MHEDTNRCDPEVDKNKGENNKVNKNKPKRAKVKVTDSSTSNHNSEESSDAADGKVEEDKVASPPDIESVVDSDEVVGEAMDTKSDLKDTPGENPNGSNGCGEVQSTRQTRSRSNSITMDLALASMHAWQKHKERSHSIIVDLFHGQSCRSNICEECGHRISRFEPFPCLSVNLRVQFAHKITVVRLPPIRRIAGTVSATGNSSDVRTLELQERKQMRGIQLL